MKWKDLGLKIAYAVFEHGSDVERMGKAIPSLKGSAKADAVAALVKESIAISEEVAGKDLVNDPELESAYRALSDAYVHLQNVVAKKSA